MPITISPLNQNRSKDLIVFSHLMTRRYDSICPDRIHCLCYSWWTIFALWGNLWFCPVSSLKTGQVGTKDILGCRFCRLLFLAGFYLEKDGITPRVGLGMVVTFVPFIVPTEQTEYYHRQFVTDLQLAVKLLYKGLTLVGTLHKSDIFLPPEFGRPMISQNMSKSLPVAP